jgi:hypothetical protein
MLSKGIESMRLHKIARTIAEKSALESLYDMNFTYTTIIILSVPGDLFFKPLSLATASMKHEN